MKRYLTPSQLRVNNTRQFIKDKYNNNKKIFFNNFKLSLIEKHSYSEEEAETKYQLLRQAIGKSKSRTFSEALQKVVEKAFSLERNILSQVRIKRKPAYIFLSCTGETANILFEKLKKNPIVDEISLLYGNIDVFIKVYGTPEEIQNLITIDLFKIKNMNINNTRTYFTLNDKSWIRHPISIHPNYEPPKYRWKK